MRKRVNFTCTWPEASGELCGQPAVSRGWCKAHYERERRRKAGAPVLDGRIERARNAGPPHVRTSLRLPVELRELAREEARRRQVPCSKVFVEALRRGLGVVR